MKGITMTTKETQQDEIASILTSNPEEKDQVVYVTFAMNSLFSFRLLQFGKPKTILADLKRQLANANNFISIFIEDQNGKLLASAVPQNDRLSYIDVTTVSYTKPKTWYRRNPKVLYKDFAGLSSGMDLDSLEKMHIIDAETNTIIIQGKSGSLLNRLVTKIFKLFLNR